MKKTRLAAYLAIYFAAVILFSVFGDELFMSNSSKTDFAMNTVISVKIKGRDSEATVQKAVDAIRQLESACLSRTSKKSDIFLLNSARRVDAADARTTEAIKTALDVCEKSGGAFDITLGAVSDLWDFESGKAALPAEPQLRAAVNAAGYKSITVSEPAVAASGAAVVDLGSIGKGVACDEVRKLLCETETKEAVVSVGGSILLYGSRDFEVGIRDPFGSASEYAAVMKVKSACVSTSGIYERGFDYNGTRYHHILSSQTGYPIQNGLVSVTAVSESGALSDALSTACFALGIKDGMALAEEYGAGAVFITQDKTVYATGSIKPLLILSGGYSFAE